MEYAVSGLKARGASVEVMSSGLHAEARGATSVEVRVEDRRRISRGGTFRSLSVLEYAVSGLEAGRASVEVMRSGVTCGITFLVCGMRYVVSLFW